MNSAASLSEMVRKYEAARRSYRRAKSPVRKREALREMVRIAAAAERRGVASHLAARCGINASEMIP